MTAIDYRSRKEATSEQDFYNDARICEEGQLNITKVTKEKIRERTRLRRATDKLKRMEIII